jgi:hypothetical protein
MPNHVANELIIRGESSVIKDFIRFARGVGIHWRGSEKPEIVKDLELSNFIHPELCRRGQELSMPYSAMATGEPMGYDWCIEQWGTKWGAYEVTLRDEDWHGDGEISYQFNTAWEPFNNRVCIEMAKLFPALRFELTFFEPGMGFQGSIIWDHTNGVISKSTDDYTWESDCPFHYEPLVSGG